MHKAGGEQLAHRVAWVLAYGQIPKGLQVMHACDHPPCVRVSHLMLGTNEANVADRQKKGRQAKGFAHGRAKITDLAVALIRAGAKRGVPQKDFVELFGVSSTLISFIYSGKRRAAVPQ